MNGRDATAGGAVSAYAARFRLDPDAVHAVLRTRRHWPSLTKLESFQLDCIAISAVLGLGPADAAEKAAILWGTCDRPVPRGGRRDGMRAVSEYGAYAGRAYDKTIESRVCGAFGILYGTWYYGAFGQIPWLRAPEVQRRALVLDMIREAESLSVDPAALTDADWRRIMSDSQSCCRISLLRDETLRTHIGDYIPCDPEFPGLARAEKADTGP